MRRVSLHTDAYKVLVQFESFTAALKALTRCDWPPGRGVAYMSVVSASDSSHEAHQVQQDHLQIPEIKPASGWPCRQQIPKAQKLQASCRQAASKPTQFKAAASTHSVCPHRVSSLPARARHSPAFISEEHKLVRRSAAMLQAQAYQAESSSKQEVCVLVAEGLDAQQYKTRSYTLRVKLASASAASSLSVDSALMQEILCAGAHSRVLIPKWPKDRLARQCPLSEKCVPSAAVLHGVFDCHKLLPSHHVGSI